MVRSAKSYQKSIVFLALIKISGSRWILLRIWSKFKASMYSHQLNNKVQQRLWLIRRFKLKKNICYTKTKRNSNLKRSFQIQVILNDRNLSQYNILNNLTFLKVDFMWRLITKRSAENRQVHLKTLNKVTKKTLFAILDTWVMLLTEARWRLNILKGGEVQINLHWNENRWGCILL